MPILKGYIQKITEHYAEKISEIQKIESIKVKIKEYSKKGKAHKYSVHAQIKAGKILASAEDADWDINRVMHKVFKDLEKQIVNKFSKRSAYKKPFT